MTSQLVRTSATEHGVATSRQAMRLLLRGCVQGIGVRPAIARLAEELALAGCVSNESFGVAIRVEGPVERLDQFRDRLAAALPQAATLTGIHEETAPLHQADSFHIVASPPGSPISTPVPRDVAACRDCLQEVFSADRRRGRYPFTTCTQCGPRYSLIDTMPWERSQSAMQAFSMCRDCRTEFESPQDRRFHAQTNACAACGPCVWLVNAAGERVASADDAVRQAVAAVRDGRILAVKGLGGYQLLCDATSARAVRELRRRKGRPSKPLAVMVENAAQAQALAAMSQDEMAVLRDRTNPILLVRRRPGTSLSAIVSPGLDTVGLLLPTTPLHALLLRETQRPLVATSGNREGEPLEYQADRALARRGGVADVALHHDRAVLRPVDDSVVRRMAGRAVTIRCARGLAPLPLPASTQHQILAVGGHQKAAIALTNGAQAVLGPHIGDLGSTASRERFVAEVSRALALYGAQPELVVHDLHPDYFTTTYAGEFGVPTLPVQHHHAHVAAAMLEHGWLGRTVLGVAFDGTGYGTDGRIWGGEFLLADVGSFERVGTLRPFPLVGGEVAVREPWRIAVALVQDACGADTTRTLAALGIDWPRPGPLLDVLARPHLSPQTTSVGRLFDGIAALVLGLSDATYEGEPAMRLEAAADSHADGAFEIPVTDEQPFQLDWRPLVRAVLADVTAGVAPGAIAMRFHRGLAQAIVNVAARYSDVPLVLAGGVFQNALLTELCARRLGNRAAGLGLPGAIPPNDGGLAAGQLAIGIHFLDKGQL